MSGLVGQAEDRPVTPLGWLAYAVAAAWIVADQVSKYLILEVVHLPVRCTVPVSPFFSLSMIWNRGVSFGLLRTASLTEPQDRCAPPPAALEIAPWALTLFAVAVAIGLAVWARRTRTILPALALGLLIGGALGNAIDRVRFGAVADFLDFGAIHLGPLHFPWVFNVADCGVTFGVVLLLLDGLIAPRKSP